MTCLLSIILSGAWQRSIFFKKVLMYYLYMERISWKHIQTRKSEPHVYLIALPKQTLMTLKIFEEFYLLASTNLLLIYLFVLLTVTGNIKPLFITAELLVKIVKMPHRVDFEQDRWLYKKLIFSM